jgi:hypothetical protein
MFEKNISRAKEILKRFVEMTEELEKVITGINSVLPKEN